MTLTRLSNAEVAIFQLDDALTLYLEDRKLVSAITLAGAAEEILGRLCETEGKPSSLSRHAEFARDLYLHVRPLFPYPSDVDPGTKPFVKLRNETKNRLKHFVSDDSIEVDLEEAAGRLIAHAVENYQCLFGYETAKMREFQRKRLKLN